MGGGEVYGLNGRLCRLSLSSHSHPSGGNTAGGYKILRFAFYEKHANNKNSGKNLCKLIFFFKEYIFLIQCSFKISCNIQNSIDTLCDFMLLLYGQKSDFVTSLFGESTLTFTSVTPTDHRRQQ